MYVMYVCMFRELGYVCALMQLLTTDVFFEIPCTSMFTQLNDISQYTMDMCAVIFSST